MVVRNDFGVTTSSATPKPQIGSDAIIAGLQAVIERLTAENHALRMAAASDRQDILRLQEDYRRVNAVLAKLTASEEGAMMILTQTIAERDAARAELAKLREALSKAANRLEWCAGIILNDGGRERAFEWVDEMRAILEESRK